MVKELKMSCLTFDYTNLQDGFKCQTSKGTAFFPSKFLLYDGTYFTL